MALTRKMLKAMGIDDEKIDQIIEAHTETVEALKSERDGFKEKAVKHDEIQKELNDLKANGGDWEGKYNKEHEAFQAYKSEQEAKELRATKVQAIRQLYKEIGISDKRLDSIVKITDIDSFELDKDGNIKDKAEMLEKAKTEFSDFIETHESRGINTPTPLSNKEAGSKTREEIMAIPDRTQRRIEIAKNQALFNGADNK